MYHTLTSSRRRQRQRHHHDHDHDHDHRRRHRHRDQQHQQQQTNKQTNILTDEQTNGPTAVTATAAATAATSAATTAATTRRSRTSQITHPMFLVCTFSYLFSAPCSGDVLTTNATCTPAVRGSICIVQGIKVNPRSVLCLCSFMSALLGSFRRLSRLYIPVNEKRAFECLLIDP